MEESYTDSAIMDIITEFICAPKNTDLYRMIKSFQWYPNGTFLFDPTQDRKLLDLFVADQERFRLQTRMAILQLLSEIEGKDLKTVTETYKHLKIKITDSVRIKFGEWGPVWQNTPVAVECIIVSMDEMEKTYTKFAEAVCAGCGNRTILKIEHYTHEVQAPGRCMNEDCPRYKEYKDIDPSTLQTGLYRIVTIQEPMEEAKGGNPRSFKCELVDDDVTKVYIGQRKLLVGAFTSYFEKRQAVQEILIKAISVNDAEPEDATATKEDIMEFKKWITRDDFWSYLCRSYAPEVYVNDQTFLAKKVISVFIAGGTRVGRLRGEINAYIAGNPGQAKSKMLGYMKLVVPKSDYVNGTTATGAGITIAYDDKLGAPKAGPVVLCSGGRVAIDELPRLKNDDQDKLLQVMEDGWLKYDKGSFNFPVQAETGILGGGNPRNDYYDFDARIVDELNLRGPFLDRFDILVNMATPDTPLAVGPKLRHIDEFRKIGEEEFVSKYDLIPQHKLRKYYSYIMKLKPVMGDAADALRQKFYTDMLAIEQKTGAIPINVRFYEGLIRLSTAIAKHYLSDTVTVEHMQEAIDLQKQALMTFGMNVEKGQVTMNLTGKATSIGSAFDHSFREVQAKFQDDYVRDEDVIKDMLERYPEYWKTSTEAWDYFERQSEHKRIVKHSGKYKMAGL